MGVQSICGCRWCLVDPGCGVAYSSQSVALAGHDVNQAGDFYFSFALSPYDL